MGFPLCVKAHDVRSFHPGQVGGATSVSRLALEVVPGLGLGLGVGLGLGLGCERGKVVSTWLVCA